MTTASSPIRLLIRADAGPAIGTGHVMRCLALGQAWQKLGGAVEMVSGPLPSRLRKRLLDNRFGLIEIRANNQAEDAENTRRAIADCAPDWVVLDGYRFDDAYQALMDLEPPTRLLVIDDYGHGQHQAADAILNQNIYATSTQYPENRKGEILTGPRYAMLRDEFQTTSFPSTSRIPATARRILVTMGGADPDNVTSEVLGFLEKCAPANTVVDVVVGPMNPHHQQLLDDRRKSSLTIRIHRNVDRMSSLYQHVDLAITAGGSTCYELCFRGVPMVVIPIAANQQPVAASLQAHQVATVINSPHELADKSTMTTVRRVIRDSSRRQQMIGNGQLLIDGQGAFRLARRLAAHLFSTLR